MLKRFAYDQLLDWKENNHQKALLVDGPRQVGKTYLVEEFGKREYRDIVKIDFLVDEDARRRFASAKSAERVIELVSLAAGHELIPGETLIFFDEVQKAQDLVTFSKYLVIDGRFDVAMSGSMLGIELNEVKSWPVGYLRTIDMAPLTFEEFCWARAVPQSVLAQVEASYHEKAHVDEVLHELLVDLFRQYLVIGGMPEAVQRSIDARNDLGAVRQVQSDLLELYREDIAKYAGDRALHVKAIYDSIPSQLDKENKRFQLKTLKTGARFDRFANDFAWLVAARSALKTVNVTEPKPMLARTEEQERFKLYLSDVGMLLASYPAQVAMDALSGGRAVNFGAVYENVVAQELMAVQSPLRYYHSSRKGEVDFLIETHEGRVLPVEVKSGKDYKLHTALNNLLGTEEYGIEEAIVLSEANVSQGQRMGKTVHYLPLYMAGLVAAEASTPVTDADILSGFKLEPIDFSAFGDEVVPGN